MPRRSRRAGRWGAAERADPPRAAGSRPVAAACSRPVGDHDVQVGVGGGLPEVVGEPQVVADEEGRADDLAAAGGDREGQPLRAWAVVVGLAGEGEGVDLCVATELAVGAGDDQGVGRLVVAGGAHRDRPAHVQSVGAGLVDQPLHGFTVVVLRDLLGVHREAGREHLREDDEVGPRGSRRPHAVGEAATVGLVVLPLEVGLDGGYAHDGLSPVSSVTVVLRGRRDEPCPAARS